MQLGCVCVSVTSLAEALFIARTRGSFAYRDVSGAIAATLSLFYRRQRLLKLLKVNGRLNATCYMSYYMAASYISLSVTQSPSSA